MRTVKIILFVFAFILGQNSIRAEVEQRVEQPLDLKISSPSQPVKWSGFLDTYYAFDFNAPNGHERSFTTTAARHNEFNINLAMLEGHYNAPDYRGTLALQWGTSVVKNYNGEPLSGQTQSDPRTVYGLDSRNLQQAFIGMRLAPSTWIDAGIFYGPIGMESWVSKYNFNYTRSLFLDYVPYYSSGLRLTHHFSEDLFAELHLVNGWQNVQEDNQEKSLSWKVDKKWQELNIIYNGHGGKEKGVYNNSRLKIYHNFIVKHRWESGHETHTAFDVGSTESQEKTKTDHWVVWALVHHMPLTQKLSMAMRGEIYRDPHNAHISLSSTNQKPFNAQSLTTTFNYQKENNLLIRLEGRYFIAKDPIFPKQNNEYSKHNLVLIQSLGLSF